MKLAFECNNADAEAGTHTRTLPAHIQTPKHTHTHRDALWKTTVIPLPHNRHTRNSATNWSVIRGSCWRKSSHRAFRFSLAVVLSRSPTPHIRPALSFARTHLLSVWFDFASSPRTICLRLAKDSGAFPRMLVNSPLLSLSRFHPTPSPFERTPVVWKLFATVLSSGSQKLT